MADDLETGIHRGSWWMPARNGGYDGQTTSTAAASVACSTTISYVDDSSNTFQETHNTQPLDYMVGAPMTRNSTLQAPTLGLSPSTMDWSQALMSCGRADTTYHPIIDQDLSSRTFLHQDPTIDSNPTGVEDSLANPFYDMNHSFLLDQNHQSSGNDPKSFQLAPANYDDQSVNYHSSAMDYCGSSSELPQTSWPKFPQASLPPMHQSSNQLHFSNIAHFWNGSANTTSDVRSGFHPPTPQSSCSNLTSKSSTQGTRGASSSTVPKKSDPTVKRPRIETPSPLPTFKVRKEKLGDRITALQQLVSPFGKTDTASVLHEAIEYIKFLHDQVSVLSTPYLKNGNPMQHQQYPDKSKDGQGSSQNLRSRGLCLVPIASTYTVASETPVDFWTPTFGGTFR